MAEANASAVGALLNGIDLPASRDEIVRYADEQGADSAELAALRGLQEREYESTMDVVEALSPVQPNLPEPEPRAPRAESGEPPGREQYTR
ncbi:MAG TPA: DUF2795 domain-containing protein [Gaiellaceae bacterium]|nr:DUF2795 domain-containing protein [Gaiellaceae bacterium]